MTVPQIHLDISKTIRGRKMFALCIDANLRKQVLDHVRRKIGRDLPIGMIADGVQIGSIK